MKLLLAIAVVTLLMLKSLHSLPVPSTESETDLAFIKAIDQKSQEFTERMEIILRKALPYVPSSRAYEIHRQELHHMLQAINDYKSNAGTCLEKRLEYSRASTRFTETYREADANDTPEHKAIVKLLNEHGMKALVDELEAFVRRTMNGEFGNPSSHAEATILEYFSTHC